MPSQDLNQGPPPRPCTACGALNLPFAPVCTKCGTAMFSVAKPSAPEGPSRSLLAGVAVLGVAVAMFAGYMVVTRVLAPSPPSQVPVVAAVVEQTVEPARTAIPRPEPTVPWLVAMSPGVGNGSAPAAATAVPRATPRPTPRPTPVTVAPPKLSAKIAGATSIRYYSISGDHPIDLARQMEKKAKKYCGRDALACVHLRPSFTLTYSTNSSTGSCTITGVRTSLRATVHMPRWTKPSRVYPELVTWWKSVFNHIAWHEGRHIRIEKSWLKKLPGMLVGKPCSSENSVFASWSRKVEAAQDAFHAAPGKAYENPPYTGPGGYFGTGN